MKNGVQALMVGAMLWAGGAQAEDQWLGVLLDVAIEAQTWEFTSKGKDIKDFQGDWISGKLSTTFTADRYYIQLNYSAPLRTSREFVGDVMTERDRDDADVVLGASAYKGLSVFIGEKYGRTRLFNNSGEVSFIENGPFAGLAWSQAIGDLGNLSVSAAYAVMDGDFIIRGTSSKTVISGDVAGYSFGATWSGPLSSKIVYKIGYKRHRYDFEGSNATTTLRNQEVMNIIFAGLSFNLR